MGRNQKPPSKIGSLIPRKAAYSAPTPAEIAGAKLSWARRIQEKERGLDEIRASFVTEFAPLCPLTYFSFGHGPGEALRAYIFFKADADVERAMNAGLIERMERRISALLETCGRLETEIILRLKSDESIRRIPGAHRFRRKECEVAGPGIWPDDANG